MSSFDISIDSENIAVLTMDMSGPVNCNNLEFLEKMSSSLDLIEQNSSLTGLVITSGKNTFFAGGDLKWLLSLQEGDGEQLHRFIHSQKSLMRRIEMLEVPVVAAINGSAVGGGFELALACNHRICLDRSSVRIGLPEMNLGLFPGGGGVIRLVHWLGVETALPLLLEGNLYGSREAKMRRLVDDLEVKPERLILRAKKWVRGVVGDRQSHLQTWDRRGSRIPGGGLSRPEIDNFLRQCGTQALDNSNDRYPAVRALLDTVVDACKVPFDVALDLETRRFTSVALSGTAKNLIYANFHAKNAVAREMKKISARKSGVEKVVLVDDPAAHRLRLVECLQAMDMRVVWLVSNVGRAWQILLQNQRWLWLKEAPGPTVTLLAQKRLKIRTTGSKPQIDYLVAVDQENGAFDSLRICEVQSENLSDLDSQRLGDCWSVMPHIQMDVFYSSSVAEVCSYMANDELVALAGKLAQNLSGGMVVFNRELLMPAGRLMLYCFAVQGIKLLAEGISAEHIEKIARWQNRKMGPLELADILGVEKLSDFVNWLTVNEAIGEEELMEVKDILRKMTKVHSRKGKVEGAGFYEYFAEGALPWVGLRRWRKPHNVSFREVEARLLTSYPLSALFSSSVLNASQEMDYLSIECGAMPRWTGGVSKFVLFNMQSPEHSSDVSLEYL